MEKVLFWDFHGTLTLRDSIWLPSLERTALEESGGAIQIYIDRDNRSHFIKLPWDFCEQDTTHIHSDGEWWEMVESSFQEFYLAFGCTKEQAVFLAPKVRQRILRPENYHLRTDAVPTLQALSSCGWHHVILSNHVPELADILDKLGIADYFDPIITSGRVGYSKPRREIFEYALERTGHPASRYMIGDNPLADIQGARQAGIPAILVNRSAESDADHAFEDLTGLLSLLK